MTPSPKPPLVDRVARTAEFAIVRLPPAPAIFIPVLVLPTMALFVILMVAPLAPSTPWLPLPRITELSTVSVAPVAAAPRPRFPSITVWCNVSVAPVSAVAASRSPDSVTCSSVTTAPLVAAIPVAPAEERVTCEAQYPTRWIDLFAVIDSAYAPGAIEIVAPAAAAATAAPMVVKCVASLAPAASTKIVAAARGDASLQSSTGAHAVAPSISFVASVHAAAGKTALHPQPSVVKPAAHGAAATSTHVALPELRALTVAAGRRHDRSTAEP